MVFSIPTIGSSLLRAFKPGLGVPCFVIPSTANMQVRHLKRKGYREKAEKKKKKAKLEKVETKVSNFERTKFQKIVQTKDRLNKPDVPLDDVFIESEFKIPKFSIVEAVTFHKEYHHPTMFDNPESIINAKIELDMTGKKVTQFIKPFKGIADFPHEVNTGKYKEVMVFCTPEETQLAFDCGATVAGGPELVKKVQTGMIQPSVYDYVLCSVNFIQEINAIRNVLKLQFPRIKQGTVAVDLKKTIRKFLRGVEYNCLKSPSVDNFGFIDCPIGNVSMTPEQVDENFKALVEDIERFRPPREGDFITWVWCTSRPSIEKFAIDVSLYQKQPETILDDDDEEVQLSDQKHKSKI